MTYKKAKIWFSIVFMFNSLFQIIVLNQIDELMQIYLHIALVISLIILFIVSYYDSKKAIALQETKKLTSIDFIQMIGMLCYFVGKVGLFNDIIINYVIYSASIAFLGIALFLLFKNK